MAHSDKKEVPLSKNKEPVQYNTSLDLASIRELILDDLDNGFLETLDSLIPGTSDLGRNSARSRLEEIRLNPLHRILVAVIAQGEACKELVVGTTTLLVEPKFIFHGGRVGHIEDVSVRKGYQNTGLGRRLVMNAIHVAKEMGCVKLVLDCSDETMPFYEKLGFSYQDNCMKKLLQD